DRFARRYHRLDDAESAQKSPVLGAEIAHADVVVAAKLAVQARHFRIAQHQVGQRAGADAHATIELVALATVGPGHQVQLNAAPTGCRHSVRGECFQCLVEIAHGDDCARVSNSTSSNCVCPAWMWTLRSVGSVPGRMKRSRCLPAGSASREIGVVPTLRPSTKTWAQGSA